MNRNVLLIGFAVLVIIGGVIATMRIGSYTSPAGGPVSGDAELANKGVVVKNSDTTYTYEFEGDALFTFRYPSSLEKATLDGADYFVNKKEQCYIGYQNPVGLEGLDVKEEAKIMSSAPHKMSLFTMNSGEWLEARVEFLNKKDDYSASGLFTDFMKITPFGNELLADENFRKVGGPKKVSEACKADFESVLKSVQWLKTSK